MTFNQFDAQQEAVEAEILEAESGWYEHDADIEEPLDLYGGDADVMYDG